MTPFLWRIVAFTLGGMFTDGYILGHIGIALSLATPELGLNGLWLGLLAASTLIGILIGAPIAGRLADRFGRRRLLALDFAVILLGALAHLLVQDPGTLLVLRTLMGIAIGAEYAIGASMLSEFAPRRHRGTLLACLNGAWIVGFVGGFAVAYVMREMGADWRAVFASAAVPALIVLLLRIGSPESPRWLLANGRRNEAQTVVSRHYGSDYGVEGMEAGKDETSTGGMRELFSPASRSLDSMDFWTFRTRTLFAGGFWACQVMPLFALTIFLPQVFEALGISGELGAEMLVNGMLLVGAVAGVFAVRFFRRRSLVIVTFGIVAVMLLAMAFSGNFPVWFGVSAFAVFVLVASGASNLEYVYPSEIFPTEIRATGMGFAAALSRVGAAASTFLLPVALEELGNMATMVILAAVAVLGLVISVLWAPETQGKSLEEASQETNK